VLLNGLIKNLVIDVVALKKNAAEQCILSRQQALLLRKQQILQLKHQLLSVKVHQSLTESDFEKTDWGKPFLKDHPSFAFNQSHSHQHYVLASSWQQQDIGIDVEDLDRVVRFERLAQHAFHEEEYALWQSHEQDPILWFKIWTTKEAVLKASGLGIRMSMNKLNTKIHVEHMGGICQHPELGTFAYQHYQLSNCILTVAWRSALSCKGFSFPHVQLIQHGEMISL
jgi:4'-phosphopantetheinyl transferase